MLDSFLPERLAGQSPGAELSAPEDARGLCPVAERCGGCPLIEREALTALREKGEEVACLLAATLGFRPQLDWAPQPSPRAYRNRIRLRVFPDGRFGFFNADKSSACAILESGLRTLLGELQIRFEPELLVGFSHFEVRARDADGYAGLFLAQGAGKGSEGRCEPRTEERQLALERAVAGLKLKVGGFASGHEQPYQRFLIAEDTYQYVPLGAFMQVNQAINGAMVAWLRDYALAKGVRRVADLYCGSGNLLLPLLSSGCEGVGVEVNAGSVVAARRAAAEQSLRGEFYDQTVCEWLDERRARRDRSTFDLVIVDAPRAGLRAEALTMAEMNVPHIALCSCNPTSLARDLLSLTSAGYRVERVRLFDMFAYTSHVEAVALLSRD